MSRQKVVTTATVLDLKAAALAVGVVVVVVFSKFWAKTRAEVAKWDFTTSPKCCYNCYKLPVFSFKNKASTML